MGLRARVERRFDDRTLQPLDEGLEGFAFVADRIDGGHGGYPNRESWRGIRLPGMVVPSGWMWVT